MPSPRVPLEDDPSFAVVVAAGLVVALRCDGLAMERSEVVVAVGIPASSQVE